MHGFVSDTDEKARDIYSAAHLDVMNRIGRERGWPPQGRAHFDQSCSPTGNLIVGSPDRVADRIIELHALFKNTRILVQMAIGTVPHAEQMRGQVTSILESLDSGVVTLEFDKDFTSARRSEAMKLVKSVGGVTKVISLDKK